ncbi:MAG: CoB--CoM heterodisulfide reductase iron-sulfur subunit B family protein [Deltaproteobacteria bacterium]|nr:CoB--CoM heterodisulfide reductase iron-sulfur subunit B family protein [Deltaproteobacteria bacterium]
MKYFYYPGCSLQGTAMEYHIATKAIMAALVVDLHEIDDWTCCGASAAEAVNSLLSLALPARNLALAELADSHCDVVIPCSACFLNLKRVEVKIREDAGLLGRLNEVLEVEGLSYSGSLKSRHLLDVLAHDLGADMIASHLKRDLASLQVAPYYGCQCLRPYGDYDDPEQPHSMELLIRALGAAVFPWTVAAKCCGAGLMTTKKEVALELTGAILAAARGADCIVTVCPMCQMNLESAQRKISRLRGEKLSIPVLYLPQLIGVALGLSAEALKLQANMIPARSLLTKVAG